VWLLLAPLALLCGCGAPPLPPGGQPAVEYWHRVLAEHPDLPARVRSIVGSGDWTPDYSTGFPASTDVRIYSEQGDVAFSGSRIELLITDLDTEALKQLLAVWEAIPEQAQELGLASSYSTSSPRRKIVVLGSQGRVDIRGVGGYDTQSIRILSDEAAATTQIGIHTFGPSGQRALEELARNYQAVRGPPASDVRSGYVSLPPPDDVLSILVIGKLQELNIEGAWGDAAQEISVAAYFNGHSAGEDLAGTPAGSPFADRLARNTPVQSTPASDNGYTYSDPAPAPVAAPAASSSSSGYSSSGYSTPQLPTPIQTPQIQVPTPLPWTPPTQTFHPPLVLPPPVFTPPPTYRPPVRFR
jgi:hypothetical protein